MDKTRPTLVRMMKIIDPVARRERELFGCVGNIEAGPDVSRLEYLELM